jgi:hypothetical protein
LSLQQACKQAEQRTAQFTLQRQKRKRLRKGLGSYLSANRVKTMAAKMSAQFGSRALMMNTGLVGVLCGEIFVLCVLVVFTANEFQKTT